MTLVGAEAIEGVLPVPPLAGAVTTGRAVARRRLRGMSLVVDTAGVGVSMLLAYGAVRAGISNGTEEAGYHLGLWVFGFLPVYVLCFGLYGLYRRERRRLFATSFPDLMYLVHALAAAGILTMAVSHLLRHFGLLPALSLTGATLISVPALVCVPAARMVESLVIRRRGIIRSRVVILGSGTVADAVVRRLAAFEDLKLLGCVDDPADFGDGGRGTSSVGLLGPIHELPAICERLDADRVIVAFSPTATPDLTDTLRLLPPKIQVSVVPRLFDLVTWRSTVDELHGLPVMDVAPPVLGSMSRATKRAIDLTVSLGAVVIALPLWVAIAVAVKLTSPGPVFFRQLRSGRRGRPFEIYKFRTMRIGADEEKAALWSANEVDGPLFKIKEDPRVTRIGRFLRATSLDEFPQLFNVIKGDMSLVGPRPFVVPESSRIDGWAARRFDVRPGMTGLWQVSGRNDLPFDELRRLDYAYVASWSPWWDLKIVWQTPGCILRRRGAY